MKKKKATPKGSPKQSHKQSIKINTPRQYRVVTALYHKPFSREEVDRIAGASNGPEVVRQLRELGWDIPCELVSHIDRDGLQGRHGIYRLSDDDRARLNKWLSRRQSMVQGVKHV